jgi:chromosome segregation ATPase
MGDYEQQLEQVRFKAEKGQVCLERCQKNYDTIVKENAYLLSELTQAKKALAQFSEPGSIRQHLAGIRLEEEQQRVQLLLLEIDALRKDNLRLEERVDELEGARDGLHRTQDSAGREKAQLERAIAKLEIQVCELKKLA